MRLILGTTPGSAPDVMARLFAHRMTEEGWGQIVVENKPGASGNLAADFVAKSPPDGYTVMVCDSTIWAINPHLFAHLAYDPLRDLTGVAAFADLPMYLTVNPSVPATDYEQFVSYARGHPGQLSYASAGNGSIHHITTELYKSMTGLDLVHVPYKGMGPGAQALLAGEVQVAFTSYAAVAPGVKAGKLRMLAVTTARRTPALATLPTLQEMGLEGFDMSSLLGALAPAATPRAVIDRLGAAMLAAAKSPEVAARMNELGVIPRFVASAPFNALREQEYEKYARLVKLSGAHMD
ncbi:MAG: hypothetical protein JO157_04735 [Acetobacteraceae bacterium]|nr:hypothetical protein [Acetobacteraceae bacterium]